MYDVATWLTNNYNTYITQYLKKYSDNEFGKLTENDNGNIFLQKSCRKCGWETSSRPL